MPTTVSELQPAGISSWSRDCGCAIINVPSWIKMALWEEFWNESEWDFHGDYHAV
jgi:hypothetical protein